MNIGRNSPHVCAVDGKIYVFGGARRAWYEYDGGFIGDVYDPVKDKWDCLPKLADFWGHSHVSPMNVVLDDPKDTTNKLILLHIRHTKPLYAYNVRKKIWECFDDEFGDEFPSSYYMWPTNVVVDNFLCCYFTRGGFFSYDLNGKEWHNIHGILGLESDDRFHPTMKEYEPALFHLGGNILCFLWSYDQHRSYDYCGQYLIGCAKFKLVATNDKRSERDQSSLSLTQHRLGYFRLQVHDYRPESYVLL
ncbi:Kelch repeat type 1 [Corchorus olitorius]|uniref:Kelch repeat type 1 n=1 Tax=Corchorus olitorius TaxID=93759 RepID=A0A1R3IZD9_9ROSI|nr:Kelch repeat type 1 [Corchorus olitorius]